LAYRAWVVLVMSGIGCSARDSKPPLDPGPIYSAVLSAPGRGYPPQDAALDPYFISDSGTFEGSGVMTSDQAAFLLRHGFVAEICQPGKVSYGTPECLAEKTHAVLRLSRPVQVAGDTVVVFVAGHSIHPRSDTSTHPLLPFGMMVECRAIANGDGWVLVGCQTRMIT
jgi:hypothetical protein